MKNRFLLILINDSVLFQSSNPLTLILSPEGRGKGEGYIHLDKVFRLLLEDIDINLL